MNRGTGVVAVNRGNMHMLAATTVDMAGDGSLRRPDGQGSSL